MEGTAIRESWGHQNRYRDEFRDNLIRYCQNSAILGTPFLDHVRNRIPQVSDRVDSAVCLGGEVYTNQQQCISLRHAEAQRVDAKSSQHAVHRKLV